MVNVAIVSAASGNESTGRLLFSKTFWDEQKSGYTLDINISGSVSKKGKPSKEDKLNVFNDHKKVLRQIRKQAISMQKISCCNSRQSVYRCRCGRR